MMKPLPCQHCEKPATIHITELTGPEPEEIHLCEEHAQQYLMTSGESIEATPTVAGVLANQLKIGQTAEELAELDQLECPVCGITFFEFRKHDRLGCPHDYNCFENELEPLLANIHGETTHLGKRPSRDASSSQRQTDLIRLRREMKEAVETENYELASQLRDEIRSIELERKQS